MKHIAAVLLSVLLLSAASCAKPEQEPTVEENNAADVKIEEPAEEIVPEEEVPTAEPGAPEDVQYVSMKTLELESKPYFQNGELILYFTNHEIWYEDDDPAYIGIISDGSAMSFPASITTSKHPELESGEDYLGVALATSEQIPAGTYNFTVTFGEYIVTFEMTIN